MNNSEFTYEQIKARMIRKLYKRANWGKSHTSIENLKKGFHQKNLGKKGLRQVNKVAEDLIRSGLLRSKPTSYGCEVSLEFTKKDELLAITGEKKNT